MSLSTRTVAGSGRATAAVLAVLTLSLGLWGCSDSNPAGPSPSETFLVDLSGAGDFTNIQEALNAASNGDTVLVAPGLYTGPGNRNLDFGALSITLRGTESRDEVVIDCEGVGRCFYIGGGAAPVIANMTVTNGDTLRGGGMYLEGTSPLIRNVRFVTNRGTEGGAGLYCRNGSPALENVLFDDNTSSVAGGGMQCVDAFPSLTNVTFLRNAAGGSGGAIMCAFSSPSLSQCVFYRNSAGFGGAIYCGESSPSVMSCTFVDNEGANGSAICCVDNSSPSISHSIIALGTPGEALYCDGGGPSTTLSCVYANGEFNELCGSYTTSMLYEDPLFCDLSNGDLRLQAGSPCLPENNPWGVRMGASGQGCE